MNNIKYVVLALISLAVGIVIGMLIKPNPLATVEISNVSSKTVQSVNITVGMTSYVIGDIGENKSKSVNIFVAGEAGYSIKVQFANGDTLTNVSDVAAGNKINETITDTSIVSSFLR